MALTQYNLSFNMEVGVLCNSTHANLNGSCFGNVSSTQTCINPLKKYEGLKTVLLTFYIVVMVLAILGNTLIIYIVYSNKSMRTSTNIFIVNMAVCDLWIPLISLPKKISDVFLGLFFWPISGKTGLALCKIFIFGDAAFIGCSTFSLLLITFDRFCAVVLPYKRHLLSKKVRVILIFCSWFLSISLASVYLRLSRLFLINEKLKCLNDFPGADSLSAYLISITCILIIAPIILVTTAYASIFYKLKKQTAILGNSLPDQQRQKEHLRQKKMVKMAFAIVCAFAICWLPMASSFFTQVYFILKSARLPCWFFTFLEVASYFLVVISVTNPVLCFIFGTTFREELSKIYRRICGCCCFCRRKIGQVNFHNNLSSERDQNKPVEERHHQLEVLNTIQTEGQ